MRLAAPPPLADPRTSAAVLAEHPGLAQAFDEDAMAAALELALRPRPGHHVYACAFQHAVYVPGAGCSLRYVVRLGGPGATATETVINARLLAEADEARARV